MDDYVKKFFDELVNSNDFDGDYFKALVNAIAMARAYSFLRNFLK